MIYAQNGSFRSSDNNVFEYEEPQNMNIYFYQTYVVVDFITFPQSLCTF